MKMRAIIVATPAISLTCVNQTACRAIQKTVG
jgi:hypothetical protein